MAGVLLFIGSCNKGGGDNPTPDPIPTTDEMYIKCIGQKIICRVPAKTYKTYYAIGKDTAVEWAGNIPIGIGGDTTLYIGHPGPRKLGVKYKVVVFAVNPDEVNMTLVWSVVAGKPRMNIDGGDYTLEKIKGKWVSTLKNGTGYDVKITGQRYTGIEFRMIWP